MTTAASGPIVVKVGGSLLDWPELPGRLAADLARRAARPLVLVAGGGPAADWVRALDRIHRLGDEQSHWLCLHALDLTAHALVRLVPDLVVVDRIADLSEAWAVKRHPVLAPRRFLEQDDRLMDHLPHTWQATTDTIAARLAVHLGASELVLLKSAPIPAGVSRAEAARLGLVDPLLPRAAAGLRCVIYRNLRDRDAADIPLHD